MVRGEPGVARLQVVEQSLVLGCGRVAVLGHRSEVLHTDRVDADRVATAYAHVEQRRAIAESLAHLVHVRLERGDLSLQRRDPVARDGGGVPGLQVALVEDVGPLAVRRDLQVQLVGLGRHARVVGLRREFGRRFRSGLGRGPGRCGREGGHQHEGERADDATGRATRASPRRKNALGGPPHPPKRRQIAPGD